MALGLYKFELKMDGTPVKSDFVYNWGWGNPPGEEDKMLNGKLWVFNFPEGMTGTHTFEGSFYDPCMALYGPQNCPHPTTLELEPDGTITTVVTFVEK